MITTGKMATQDDRDITADLRGFKNLVGLDNEQRNKVAEIVLKVIEEQARFVVSSKELSKEDVQASVVRRVQQIVRDNPPMQLQLDLRGFENLVGLWTISYRIPKRSKL